MLNSIENNMAQLMMMIAIAAAAVAVTVPMTKTKIRPSLGQLLPHQSVRVAHRKKKLTHNQFLLHAAM